MKLIIPFIEIEAAYPEVVAEALAGLRKGRSKDRNVPAEDMEWSLDWGVLIEGDHSFGGLLSRMQQPLEDREAKRRAAMNVSVDDRLADLRRRIPRVSVCGSYKRAYAEALLPKGEHPEVFVAHLRAGVTDLWERDQLTLSKTPEQREQEAQEALAQLIGTPGFMVIGGGT